MMFERLMKRAGRAAERRAEQRAERLAERMREKLPSDMGASAEAGGVRIGGAGARRRFATEAGLRWLALDEGRGR